MLDIRERIAFRLQHFATNAECSFRIKKNIVPLQNKGNFQKSRIFAMSKYAGMTQRDISEY